MSNRTDYGAAAVWEPTPVDPRLVDLGRAMQEGLDGIVDRVVRRTKAERADYAGVPADELQARSRDELEAWIEPLLEGRVPRPEELLDTEPLARRRFEQGVTPEGIGASVQIFADEARAFFEDYMASSGLTRSDLGEFMYFAWKMSDEITRNQAGELARLEAEVRERAEAARRDFLIETAEGSLAGSRLRARASAVGLDPEGAYIAVCGRPLAGTAAELRRELERRQPTTVRTVVAVVEDEVLAVVSEAPPSDTANAWGVGPRVALDGVRGSLLRARAACEAAWSFGRAGAHDLRDLGALPAVAQHDQVGELFAERILGPLEKTGGLGATLLDTIDAYIASGMRVDATAEALHLHPNSLRKRLRRFEELTGCDVRRFDDLLAAWWALRVREKRVSGPASAP